MVSIAPEKHPDSLTYWVQKYRELAVDGIRSEAVGKKIILHLNRFLSFFRDTYGHDRISGIKPIAAMIYGKQFSSIKRSFNRTPK